MALEESALSQVRAAIEVGRGGDLIRQLAEWAMQEIIEAEAAEVIGARPYERTELRSTERNGHRSRVLSDAGLGGWTAPRFPDSGCRSLLFRGCGHGSTPKVFDRV